MTFIEIGLLSLFEHFVVFAKFLKVWLGKSLLIFNLWKIRSELPPHRQFCLKYISLGKGSSPVVKECHVWITCFLE